MIAAAELVAARARVIHRCADDERVNSRSVGGLWALSLAVLFPASLLLWFVGGTAACGMEVYDTPPGSTGDHFCTHLVDPVWPWAALAASPLALGLALGLLALKKRSRWLLALAACLPFALVLLGVFGALALF